MLSAKKHHNSIFAPMMTDQGDNPRAVAARLQKARMIYGLTKKEFGERAGLSEQVYGAFENARRPLSLDAAKKLRKTYQLSLEFMYFGNVADLPTRISREL